MRSTRSPAASRTAVRPVPMNPRAPATATVLAVWRGASTRASSGSPALDRLRVEQPPEIPRRDGAVRSPALADLLHAFGCRHGPQSIGALNALAHAKVAGGKHIGAAEAEHEEHLHRPGPDPTHLDELGEDFLVVESMESLDRKPAIGGVRGEIAQRRQLLSREAGLPEALVRQGQE